MLDDHDVLAIERFRNMSPERYFAALQLMTYDEIHAHCEWLENVTKLIKQARLKGNDDDVG